MLKGIHPLITPDLLAVLARMGHGDVLAIVDRNYPAYGTGRDVIAVPGVTTTQMADAICELMPVDTFVERPLAVMTVVGDEEAFPEVQREFVSTVERVEGRSIGIERLERFAFYRRAAEAFAVVATGEERPYGCFLVTKGIL